MWYNYIVIKREDKRKKQIKKLKKFKKLLTNSNDYDIINTTNKENDTLKNEKGNKIMSMTQREFFEKVIKANVSDELTTKAQELIAGLDKRNAQKSSKPTKTQAENEVLKGKMLETLEKGRGYLAVEIGTAMGFSTSKASALAKQLVNEGKATVADVKVKNKGTQKSYTILVEPIEVADETE